MRLKVSKAFAIVIIVIIIIVIIAYRISLPTEISYQ